MRFSHRLGFVVISCLVVASTALAQDDWMNTRDSFICRSSNEVREIKTYISEDRRSCRVDYIKNGKTSTLWSSSSVGSFCGSKASGLAAKLGHGNFSCQPLHLLGGSDKD